MATHNHFVLDRGGKVFKQSAPVIKLPAGASEDDHLALLGVLNSSTACFWLKQVSHNKGGRGVRARRSRAERGIDRYEFTGTKLEEFPLPTDLPLDRRPRSSTSLPSSSPPPPSTRCATTATPTRDRLAAAHAEWLHLARRDDPVQEELDWDVYRSYGLLTDAEAAEVLARTRPGSEPGRAGVRDRARTQGGSG